MYQVFLQYLPEHISQHRDTKHILYNEITFPIPFIRMGKFKYQVIMNLKGSAHVRVLSLGCGTWQVPINVYCLSPFENSFLNIKIQCKY